jgi:hypothetical protein
MPLDLLMYLCQVCGEAYPTNPLHPADCPNCGAPQIIPNPDPETDPVPDPPEPETDFELRSGVWPPQENSMIRIYGTGYPKAFGIVSSINPFGSGVIVDFKSIVTDYIGETGWVHVLQHAQQGRSIEFSSGITANHQPTSAEISFIESELRKRSMAFNYNVGRVVYSPTRVLSGEQYYFLNESLFLEPAVDDALLSGVHMNRFASGNYFPSNIKQTIADRIIVEIIQSVRNYFPQDGYY